MKLAFAVFVGICLGQAETSRYDIPVICSKGLAGDSCRDAQAAVRRVIEDLFPSLRDWRIVIVPDEQWATECKRFRLKPRVPVFSNLTMRATYLTRRLAVLGEEAGVDEDLLLYTRLTGEDRLKWALAHELGHVLGGATDQDGTNNVRLSPRVSRYPAGFVNGAPRESPEVAVSLTNANMIPPIVLAIARSTARRIFGGIGVELRLTYKAGQPISMRFDYEVGEAVHPGALGYALPYAKTETRIHILYDRLGTPAGSVSAGVLLGHVMAHELAHVLGFAEHSLSGVMKAKWDRQDMAEMQRQPLSFGLEEAAAIRTALGVR